MYSAQSFVLSKSEYDYLLPVMRKKLGTRILPDKTLYYITVNNIGELTDVLDIIKVVYDFWDKIPAILVLKCSRSGSLKDFRDFVN